MLKFFLSNIIITGGLTVEIEWVEVFCIYAEEWTIDERKMSVFNISSCYGGVERYCMTVPPVGGVW